MRLRAGRGSLGLRGSWGPTVSPTLGSRPGTPGLGLSVPAMNLGSDHTTLKRLGAHPLQHGGNPETLAGRPRSVTHTSLPMTSLRAQAEGVRAQDGWGRV